MNFLSLTIGGIYFVSGIGIAVFPKRKRDAVVARNAELATGASDRFFEERRTIEAYPLPKTEKGWRIKGIAMASLGVLMICLGLYS